MRPTDFNKMFELALTDKKFQKDLRKRGFKALDERGFRHGVPPELQTKLEKAIGLAIGGKKPRCGVCGVCGVCGLCGEVNFGSASAALWALFALAGVGTVGSRE
jgi:hypothetical protein